MVLHEGHQLNLPAPQAALLRGQETSAGRAKEAMSLDEMRWLKAMERMWEHMPLGNGIEFHPQEVSRL